MEFSDSAGCTYFCVEVKREGQSVVLHLKGELDMGSAKIVAAKLASLEAEIADPMVLEMSQVSFLDCSGLSVLLGAASRAERDDRRVVIVNARPEVRRIFALTGCKSLLSDPDLQNPEGVSLPA